MEKLDELNYIEKIAFVNKRQTAGKLGSVGSVTQSARMHRTRWHVHIGVMARLLPHSGR